MQSFVPCKKECNGNVKCKSIVEDYNSHLSACPSDATDDYVHIGEDITLECVRRFYVAMIGIYGPEYLRAPTTKDIERITTKSEERSWSPMLGSIDCMH